MDSIGPPDLLNRVFFQVTFVINKSVCPIYFYKRFAKVLHVKYQLTMLQFIHVQTRIGRTVHENFGRIIMGSVTFMVGDRSISRFFGIFLPGLFNCISVKYQRVPRYNAFGMSIF